MQNLLIYQGYGGGKMRKLLLRFPLRYYLNPISVIGIAFMTFLQYSKWVSLFAKIAEYERNNVTHWHNHFELIPSTIMMIGWTVLNVLLYPYVYDAIIRLAAQFFGSNIVFRGMIKNTITIYNAEIEKGDIYTGSRVQYNAYGYPIGVIPEFDRAKPRAFTKSSEYFIMRLAISIAPVMVFILLLWGGWMLSAVIGWIFALTFTKER